MTDWMIDNRSTALRTICDTVVPSIQRVDDPTGFWARKSTGIVTEGDRRRACYDACRDAGRAARSGGARHLAPAPGAFGFD